MSGCIREESGISYEYRFDLDGHLILGWYEEGDETYYYYHLAGKAFDTIREKDSVSGKVIPEVIPYEE